jgi:hypothetical protein
MPIRATGKGENTTMEPGRKSLTLVYDTTPITAGFLHEISTKGGLTTYFFGRIVYETLGNEHYTEFCAYLMPLDTSAVPETPATAGVAVDKRYALRQCKEWHGAQ